MEVFLRFMGHGMHATEIRARFPLWLAPKASTQPGGSSSYPFPDGSSFR